MWITSDTHLGHAALRSYCGRPANADEIILKRLGQASGVLVHLGDICIGNDVEWNERLRGAFSGKMWLVRGNHDKKSTTWYLSHGWDFVADSFCLEAYGHRILFSHVPQAGNYSINIHGHFHNSDHRRHEEDLVAIRNERQILVSLEDLNYSPIKLDRLISSQK